MGFAPPCVFAAQAPPSVFVAPAPPYAFDMVVDGIVAPAPPYAFDMVVDGIVAGCVVAGGDYQYGVWWSSSWHGHCQRA